MFSACDPTLPGTPRLVASWAFGIIEPFSLAFGAGRLHSEFARFFYFGQYRVHSGIGICPSDRVWRGKRQNFLGSNGREGDTVVDKVLE